MRVGHQYQTPNTMYGSNGKSRAEGRGRAAGGEAEASGTGGEPKKTGTNEDSVELSGAAEERTRPVAAAAANQAHAEEPGEPPPAEDAVDPEETDGTTGGETPGDVEETEEEREARLLEEARKAAEKAAEEEKKAEEEAAAEARKQALQTIRDDFKSFLNKQILSPGLSKAPINITIADEAFERMLDDPAYKKEMEHKIMRELMNMNWLTTSPDYMHIQIDSSGKFSATPYIGSVSSNYTAETKNAFWTKGTDAKSADKTPEEELIEFQREMFDMLRGESTAERRLFQAQLMNQYRVSMMSYLNQGYADNSLSTFSSLI